MLDNVDYKQGIFDIVNDVLMMLNLPLNTFDLNTLPLNEDASLILRVLTNNTRSELSKGWWFNTWEDFFVPAGSGFVDLNGYRPLSVSPSPISDLECPGEHFMIVNNNLVTTASVHYNAQASTLDTKLDVVVALDLYDCPVSFQTYIKIKTANDFGRTIGFPPDELAEVQALSTLEDEHEESLPRRNRHENTSIGVKRR